MWDPATIALRATRFWLNAIQSPFPYMTSGIGSPTRLSQDRLPNVHLSPPALQRTNGQIVWPDQAGRITLEAGETVLWVLDAFTECQVEGSLEVSLTLQGLDGSRVKAAPLKQGTDGRWRMKFCHGTPGNYIGMISAGQSDQADPLDVIKLNRSTRQVITRRTITVDLQILSPLPASHSILHCPILTSPGEYLTGQMLAELGGFEVLVVPDEFQTAPSNIGLTDLVDACSITDVEIALEFDTANWLRGIRADHSDRTFGLNRDTQFDPNPIQSDESSAEDYFLGHQRHTHWQSVRHHIQNRLEAGVRIIFIQKPLLLPLAFWSWLTASLHADFPETRFVTNVDYGFAGSQHLLAAGITPIALASADKLIPHSKISLINLLGHDAIGVPAPFAPTHAEPIDLSVSLYQDKLFALPVPQTQSVRTTQTPSLTTLLAVLAAPVVQIPYVSTPTDRSGLLYKILQLRRQFRAFGPDGSIQFLNAWNDNVLYFARLAPTVSECILCALNLTPDTPQEAHFEVPLWLFGLNDSSSIEVKDLLTSSKFHWTGKVQHLRLTPVDNPCMIWLLNPERAGLT